MRFAFVSAFLLLALLFCVQGNHNSGGDVVEDNNSSSDKSNSRSLIRIFGSENPEQALKILSFVKYLQKRSPDVDVLSDRIGGGFRDVHVIVPHSVLFETLGEQRGRQAKKSDATLRNAVQTFTFHKNLLVELENGGEEGQGLRRESDKTQAALAAEYFSIQMEFLASEFPEKHPIGVRRENDDEDESEKKKTTSEFDDIEGVEQELEELHSVVVVDKKNDTTTAKEEEERERETTASSLRANSFHETYHSFEAIVAQIQSLVDAAPSELNVEFGSHGTSVENRPIYTVEFGSSSNKRAFFMTCGLHAREWIGPASCVWMLEQFLSPNPSATVESLLSKLRFVVFPVVNPDGYEFSRTTGNRYHRKNKGIPNHVDLNRNFDEHWGVGTSEPAYETYQGPSVFSEPESQAVRDRILFFGGKESGEEGIRRYTSANPEEKEVVAVRDEEKSWRITIAADVHSFGQTIYRPYGWTEDAPPNNDDIIRLCDAMVAAAYSKHGYSYRHTPASEGGIAGAACDDYFTSHTLLRTGLTLELRPDWNGGTMFELPADQIVAASEEAFEMVKVMALHAIEKLGLTADPNFGKTTTTAAADSTATSATTDISGTTATTTTSSQAEQDDVDNTTPSSSSSPSSPPDSTSTSPPSLLETDSEDEESGVGGKNRLIVGLVLGFFAGGAVVASLLVAYRCTRRFFFAPSPPGGAAGASSGGAGGSSSVGVTTSPIAEIQNRLRMAAAYHHPTEEEDHPV